MSDNVTPIDDLGNDPSIEWPGTHAVNRQGAALARDMLDELEDSSMDDDCVSVRDYSALENWARQGRPFRNVVAEYLALAQAAGPGDPEVGEVLNEVMARLCQAEDVATVVARALAHEFGPGSIPLRLSRVLELSCARVLGEQRKQIQRVIDGASFAGPRLVINSNKLKGAEREVQP